MPVFLLIILLLITSSVVYFYKNKKKPITSFVSCKEFTLISDYVLENIAKPDNQEVIQTNSSAITNFLWKRNISEPFITYPIIKGNKFTYEEIVKNDSGGWKKTETDTQLAIKNASDTINKNIVIKAESLGFNIDQPNNISPQSFFSTGECGGTDFINTFGFRKGEDLYSIVLKGNKSTCAPAESSITVTCGKAINQYDKVYSVLNLKADTKIQNPYENDYVKTLAVSPNNTIFALSRGMNMDNYWIANYYYFDGNTLKLVSKDNYPAKCSTLESQKIGKGMKCDAYGTSKNNNIVNY